MLPYMIVKEKIRCATSLIEGGLLRYVSNIFGSVAKLSCILPYTLNDEDDLYVCNTQGNWIGKGQCGNKNRILLFHIMLLGFVPKKFYALILFCVSSLI